LAVVFFTPDKINPNATAEIIVNAEGDRKLNKQRFKKYKTEKMDLGMGMVSGLLSQLLGSQKKRRNLVNLTTKKLPFISTIFFVFLLAQEGRAYIFNCPYSSLCRQVVTDPQGRVAHFDFKGNSADTVLKVSLSLYSLLIL
jgi:hypothetical protein